jgi:hypothetical protein
MLVLEVGKEAGVVWRERGEGRFQGNVMGVFGSRRCTQDVKSECGPVEGRLYAPEITRGLHVYSFVIHSTPPALHANRCHCRINNLFKASSSNSDPQILTSISYTNPQWHPYSAPPPAPL